MHLFFNFIILNKNHTNASDENHKPLIFKCIRKISSEYTEEKWFLLVYKIFAVVCLNSNIDAYVTLQVIKLTTKQKVKMMGKMLNGFAAIARNYGIIHRVFYRNGHRTSLALEKTGSVMIHDMIYIFNYYVFTIDI